jgi:hypothetical protein
MRIALSNEQILVSLPSGAVSLLSFEPQTHRQVAAGAPDHAAAPQRVAHVFQFGTRLLVINAANVLERDRAPLVRILRERAGVEPTIALLTSSSFHTGFISGVTLEPGACAADGVACALAGLNVIASWDESEKIDVELDGTRVTVRMRLESGAWDAEIVGRGATILYRPVGLEELHLVYEANMRAFPPRLPDQPIFYPVTNEAYARQIARDWNTKSGTRAGFVTRFAIDAAYAARFERRVVGAREHEELWVPAEELAELNAKIDGTIEIVAAYFGGNYRGAVPDSFGLKGKDAGEQFVALARTLPLGSFDIVCEIAANHAAVFLNFPFWQQCDFGSEGFAPGERDEILAKLRRAWASGERGAIPLGIGE